MFINPAALKRQIKKVYNTSGIRFGYQNGGVVVIAGYWIAWFDSRNIPNNIRAIITEFLGFVPSEPSLFFVSKDKPMAQFEIDDEKYNILTFTRLGFKSSTDTKVCIDRGIARYRIFQNNDSKTLICMNEELLSLYDPEQIDFDNGETRPDEHIVTYDGSLFYKNSSCQLLLLRSILAESEVLRQLELINFEEEENK